MVLIKAGTNSGTDPDSGAYSLKVNAFYIDKNEVTKALWDDAKGKHGFGFAFRGCPGCSRRGSIW